MHSNQYKYQSDFIFMYMHEQLHKLPKQTTIRRPRISSYINNVNQRHKVPEGVCEMSPKTRNRPKGADRTGAF